NVCRKKFPCASAAWYPPTWHPRGVPLHFITPSHLRNVLVPLVGTRSGRNVVAPLVGARPGTRSAGARPGTRSAGTRPVATTPPFLFVSGKNRHIITAAIRVGSAKAS